MLATIILGVSLILLGLFFIYLRYRIIIGGTLCKGKAAEFKPINVGKGNFYSVSVSFIYNDELKTLPITLQTVSSLRLNRKKEFSVYFNEKYPKEVARKGIRFDITSIILIAAGIFIISTCF